MHTNVMQKSTCSCLEWQTLIAIPDFCNMWPSLGHSPTRRWAPLHSPNVLEIQQNMHGTCPVCPHGTGDKRASRRLSILRFSPKWFRCCGCIAHCLRNCCSSLTNNALPRRSHAAWTYRATRRSNMDCSCCLFLEYICDSRYVQSDAHQIDQSTLVLDSKRAPYASIHRECTRKESHLHVSKSLSCHVMSGETKVFQLFVYRYVYNWKQFDKHTHKMT